MNFPIPRNISELLLYTWKIIDLPIISTNDLIYKISYEFFILPPQKATEFVQKSIKSNLLKKDEYEHLSLSTNLEKMFQNWQKKRTNTILKKIDLARKKAKIIDDLKKDRVSNFNLLLKAFLDKGTINRAVDVSDDTFNLIEFDENKGIIVAEVAGSKEKSYQIEINKNEKILRHNCHDFKTRRAENKKFCKHLAKLFLLLKEKSEESAAIFLQDIAENISEWKFCD